MIDDGDDKAKRESSPTGTKPSLFSGRAALVGKPVLLLAGGTLLADPRAALEAPE